MNVLRFFAAGILSLVGLPAYVMSFILIAHVPEAFHNGTFLEGNWAWALGIIIAAWAAYGAQQMWHKLVDLIMDHVF